MRRWLRWLRGLWRGPLKKGPHPYLPADPRDSDVYVVSYPKSGSTWLRFMLASYILGEPCDFLNFSRVVPDIHSNPQDCAELGDPRLIKSHMPYVPEYGRVIYLVRDGRDVAVSFYYHQMKHNQINETMAFTDFLDVFHTEEISVFGRWSTHVMGWLDARRDMLLVRYEALDNAETLEEILHFCGFKVEGDRLRMAMHAANFERMQGLEAAQHDEIPTLLDSRGDMRFVRRGKVGGWQAYFSEADEETFWAVHGAAMTVLGYTI